MPLNDRDFTLTEAAQRVAVACPGENEWVNLTAVVGDKDNAVSSYLVTNEGGVRHNIPPVAWISGDLKFNHVSDYGTLTLQQRSLRSSTRKKVSGTIWISRPDLDEKISDATERQHVGEETTDWSSKPIWPLRVVLCWIATGKARDKDSLDLTMEGYDGAVSSFNSAEEALVSRLQSGEIGVTGKPRRAIGVHNFSVGARETVPEIWWHDPVTLDAEKNEARLCGVSIPRDHSYLDLQFKTDVVRALWPSHDDDNGATATRISANEIESAYKKRVAEWPTEERHPSREEDEAWGRELGVKREFIRELRRKFAPPAWQEAKRPPKSGKIP